MVLDEIDTCIRDRAAPCFEAESAVKKEQIATAFFHFAEFSALVKRGRVSSQLVMTNGGRDQTGGCCCYC